MASMLSGRITVLIEDLLFMIHHGSAPTTADAEVWQMRGVFTLR